MGCRRQVPKSGRTEKTDCACQPLNVQLSRYTRQAVGTWVQSDAQRDGRHLQAATGRMPR